MPVAASGMGRATRGLLNRAAAGEMPWETGLFGQGGRKNGFFRPSPFYLRLPDHRPWL